MRATLILILITIGWSAKAQYFEMDKDPTAYTMQETKELQSLPGAPYIIYVNVTGYYVWKNEPQHVAQVVRVWRQLAEDYRPFNVNVTTRVEDWNNTPKSNALHMSINIHYAGGSCPLGMYGRGESWGGQNCHSSLQFYSFTHETGHGMGIHHHLTYENLIGDGFKYVNTHVSTNHNGAYFSHWMNGEVEGGGTTDDVALLRSQLGTRASDHGDTYATASDVVIDNENVSKLSNNGTITKDGEVDMFKFTTNGGEIDLNINPLLYYNNLHAKADLVDEEGTVVIAGVSRFHFNVNTDYPEVPDDLKGRLLTQVKQAVNIKGDLGAGTYYIKVTNSGFVDEWGDGYTSYSSLGYYEMEGTIESNPVSVESEIMNANIHVYPNPAVDFLKIKTDLIYESSKIYDLNGSLVQSNNAAESINISFLTSGKYTIKFIGETGVIGVKQIVIKQ